MEAAGAAGVIVGVPEMGKKRLRLLDIGTAEGEAAGTPMEAN